MGERAPPSADANDTSRLLCVLSVAASPRSRAPAFDDDDDDVVVELLLEAPPAVAAGDLARGARGRANADSLDDDGDEDAPLLAVDLARVRSVVGDRVGDRANMFDRSRVARRTRRTEVRRKSASTPSIHPGNLFRESHTL
jgi:hypothetical protein